MAPKFFMAPNDNGKILIGRSEVELSNDAPDALKPVIPNAIEVPAVNAVELGDGAVTEDKILVSRSEVELGEDASEEAVGQHVPTGIELSNVAEANELDDEAAMDDKIIVSRSEEELNENIEVDKRRLVSRSEVELSEDDSEEEKTMRVLPGEDVEEVESDDENVIFNPAVRQYEESEGEESTKISTGRDEEVEQDGEAARLNAREDDEETDDYEGTEGLTTREDEEDEKEFEEVAQLFAREVTEEILEGEGEPAQMTVKQKFEEANPGEIAHPAHVHQDEEVEEEQVVDEKKSILPEEVKGVSVATNGLPSVEFVEVPAQISTGQVAGQIVGGVVAGVMLTLLALWAVLCIKKRNASKRAQNWEVNDALVSQLQEPVTQRDGNLVPNSYVIMIILHLIAPVSIAIILHMISELGQIVKRAAEAVSLPIPTLAEPSTLAQDDIVKSIVVTWMGTSSLSIDRYRVRREFACVS
ncbi:hypothetical protein M501DRAFT_988118 [Patellaria atrata CBS 101060]|uniref:Uncharacterized protein n=1 Tax=Patellaria atrata CBS 101060 TaxID=1346257 RepID=A0A9P4SG12_9PEZI|nr:hypothetical protein M501DRAFT_988118 [Patellaria atrata CBS 101060]